MKCKHTPAQHQAITWKLYLERFSADDREDDHWMAETALKQVLREGGNDGQARDGS